MTMKLSAMRLKMMSLVMILTLKLVMAQVEPDASLDTAERRTATAQGGNGRH